MSKSQNRNRWLLLVSSFLALGALLITTGLTIIPGEESNPLPGVGLVSITTSSRDFPGSGVVVGPRHVLTAKHCVNTNDPNVVRFQEQGDSPVTPIAIYKHPDPSVDLAVLEFSQADSFSVSYGLYSDEDEEGKTITIVGFGWKGVPVTTGCGWTFDENSWGTQRWGKNVVSIADGAGLYYDFDGGTHDRYGDGGPITNEAGVAGVDSGGPSFITTNEGDLLVAGIHVTVLNDPCATTYYGWGSASVDFRVSQFVEWIEAQMQ